VASRRVRGARAGRERGASGASRTDIEVSLRTVVRIWFGMSQPLSAKIACSLAIWQPGPSVKETRLTDGDAPLGPLSRLLARLLARYITSTRD